MNKVLKKVRSIYQSTGLKAYAFIERNANTIMFVFGMFLVVTGLEQTAYAIETFTKAGYDDTLVSNAVGNLFCLIEGAFGALIMVVSGLGAIVAAAMGAYRAAVGMLVVAVGSFILRALVSLFFGTNFAAKGDADQGGSGNAACTSPGSSG